MFGVIAIAIVIRLTVYGDLRLSVVNPETVSYVDFSKVNPCLWDAFTSYRPYTTNLVYKTFTPPDGYRYQALASNDSGTIREK